MGGVALRTLAGAVSAAIGITLAAAPAAADTASVTVTLAPSSAPVGSTLAITAPSGLATVTQVRFTGSAASVNPAQPPTDTEVDVVVPADAASGPLTLTYSNSTSAQTDQSFTLQVPTSGTITLSHPWVVFPNGAAVRALLTAAGQPVSGVTAHLQRAAPHTTAWQPVQDARTTSSTGRVHWTVSPASTATYRVVFDDAPAYLGTTTQRVRLAVTPLVIFRTPDVAPILTKTALRGRVRPAPAADREVRLQQRVDGSWHRVARASTDRRGHYTFTVTLPATGHYAYRVRRPHDDGHLSATSAVGRVQAVQRTLHSGMSGSDVTALQRRLQKLRYDVGAVNGTFGFDTQHAVVAFQKVQGLARDGVVGLKVWKALTDPRRPKLRHPADASTAGVEVDLTRQVLYYAVKGRIVRILDSSTGGGYTYTGSDGSTQRAVTPTGHFGVVYKRDGWVHAPLGELYRPAYFNYSGYAIHGETEVPSYPASHGCVRITVPAMDRMNAKLYVGISVWIYRS